MNWNHVKRKLKGRSGVTLAEVLIVIAIIGVLVGLGYAGATNISRNVEQAKLERIAENIFSAAQNQLSQRALLYGGNSDALQPRDALGNPDTLLLAKASVEGRTLYFASHDGTAPAPESDPTYTEISMVHADGPAASPSAEAISAMILPLESISAELRSGSWIIEYEPATFSVYSVFYSEKYSNFSTAYSKGDLEKMRDNIDERKAAGVGYYNGTLPDKNEKRVGAMDLSLVVDNGEKLTMTIECMPESGLFTSETDKVNVEFVITVQDASKPGAPGWTHTVTQQVGIHGFKLTGVVSGTPGTYESQDPALCLDSLTGNHFSDYFSDVTSSTKGWKAESGAVPLAPGCDIIVTVDAHTVTTTSSDPEVVKNQKQLLPASVSSGQPTNSIFADTSSVSSANYTAKLSYGRHLQNLDVFTSGFDCTKFGASWVIADQANAIDFGKNSEWQKAYPDGSEGRAFVPIINENVSEYHGNYMPIKYLTVKTAGARGNAGLFDTFYGHLFEKTVLEDAAVTGGTSSGGLAGNLASDAKLDECRLYMTSARHGVEDANAQNVVWMNGTAYAGGLVGSTTGSITIVDSFAATVVRGSMYAGGLVGFAGTLSVSNSYADAYLDGATVGGLAGTCSSGSFTNCYSAGFVLNARSGMTAAGFVPSSAKVTNGYSVLCFNDPFDSEHRTTATLADGKEVVAFTPVDGMTRYALTASVSAADDPAAKNAYYTDSTAIAKDGAQLKSGTNPEGIEDYDPTEYLRTIPVFGPVTSGTASMFYNLSDVTQLSTWVYPALKSTGGKILPHYNDYYVVEGSTVTVERVLLGGTGETASISTIDTFDGYRNGSVVLARADSRLAQDQVFVGWFTAAQIREAEAHADDWANAIDNTSNLKISKKYWWYVTNIEDDTTRIASVQGQTALSSTLPEDPNTQNEKVTLPASADKLYALYRETQRFDVVILYNRFEVENFQDSVGNPDLTMTTQKYLDRYYYADRIPHPIYVYEVDPIVERNEPDYPYKTLTLDKLENDKGEPDFEIITDEILKTYYTEAYTGIAPIWGFKDSKTPFTSDEMKKISIADYTNRKVTVDISKAYTYSVLFDSRPVPVTGNFYFLHSTTGSDKYEDAEKTLAQLAQQINTKLKGVQYVDDTTAIDYDNVDYTNIDSVTNKYKAVVAMNFPQGVSVWPYVSALKFDGFTLKKIENTIVDPSTMATNPLSVFYERDEYTLNFDLNGGIYYDGTSRTGVIEPLPVYYGKLLKDCLKRGYDITAKFKASGATNLDGITDIPADTVFRMNYQLSGWYLYKIENYKAGADPDLKLTVNMNASDTTNYGYVVENKLMQPGDYIAVAQWEPVTMAKIRLEIYVQDVTDPVDAATKGTEHYYLYNYYFIDKEVTVSNYTKVANNTYSELMNKVYKDTKRTCLHTINSKDDPREYLNKDDGTKKCPQLTYNSAKSEFTDDKGVKYYDFDFEVGGSNTAVIKLYFTRNKITFNFLMESGSFSDQAPKTGGVLPYGGYIQQSISGSSGKFTKKLYGTDCKIYVIDNNAVIDEFTSDFDKAFDKYFDDATTDGWYTKDSSLETKLLASEHEDIFYYRTGGSNYVFGQLVPISGSPSHCVLIPFYTTTEVNALTRTGTGDDRGYSWQDGGLMKVATLPTFVGLYEAPFSTYQSAKWPNGYVWPGNGMYLWKMYPSENKNHVIGNSTLTTLDGFFFESWIKDDDYAGSTVFNIKGTRTSSASNYVSFYLEKTDNDRDTNLRTKLNGNQSLSWGSDYYERKMFKFNPEYVVRNNATGFNNNNKYTGYSANLYNTGNTTSFSSTYSGASLPANVSIFNTREMYNVYFKGLLNDKEDTYLYGATLDSLPDVTSADMPINLSADYHFVGWNTRSDGKGEWWTWESGTTQSDRAASGTYDKWQTGTLIAHEGSVPEDAKNPHSVKMPAGDLTVFAIWSNSEVTVHCYTMMYTEDDQTQITERYNQAKEVSIKTLVGYTIDEQLKELGIPATVTNENGDAFEFAGWRIATAQQVSVSDPTSLEYTSPGNLELAFNANSPVAVSGTEMYLVACWKQTAGKMAYNIRFALKDLEDNITYMTLTSDQCGFPRAPIGAHLQVKVPTYGKNPYTDELYPENHPLAELTQYDAMSALANLEKDGNACDLTADYCTVEILYYMQVPWSCEVQGIVKFANVPVVFYHTFETTTKANFNAKAPSISFLGYALEPNQEVISILRPTTEGEKGKVSFEYTLSSGVIDVQGGTRDWDLADGVGGRPTDLFAVNAYGEALLSLDNSATRCYWVTTTTYSKDGSVVFTETRTSQPDTNNKTPFPNEQVVTTGTIVPGVYSTEVKVELYRVGTAEPIYTFMEPASSATVNVYKKVSVTLDGKAEPYESPYYCLKDGQFYKKNDDGTFTQLGLTAGSTQFASLLGISDEELRTMIETELMPEGKTMEKFMGFFDAATGGNRNILVNPDRTLHQQFINLETFKAAVNSGAVTLYAQWAE